MILAPLGLGSITYLRENRLGRRQYTDNERFVGCIHVRMLQQFTHTVLELTGLSFKNRDLVIQRLREMMKLQQGDMKNIYTFYGGLSFRLSEVGRREEMDIPRDGERLSHVKKLNSSNQKQTDKSLLGKETIRPVILTSQKVRASERATDRENHTLIFQLFCDKETISANLLPDLALV